MKIYCDVFGDKTIVQTFCMFHDSGNALLHYSLYMIGNFKMLNFYKLFEDY